MSLLFLDVVVAAGILFTDTLHTHTLSLFEECLCLEFIYIYPSVQNLGGIS